MNQRNGPATALIYAINAGDLEGMELLLTLGAEMNVEQNGVHLVLAAACQRKESELLEHLLARGLDVTPFPDQLATTATTQRLLRDARAGRSPSWATCTICRELPHRLGWCHSANGERTGEAFPITTAQFETFWSLWKCPRCSTCYDFDRDHDNGITDGWDSEYLTRISLEEALSRFQAMDSEPRAEREIAALNERLHL